MYARAFVLSSVFLCLARASNASDLCAEEYTYSYNDSTVNITQNCKEKACITKCCPGGYIFLVEDNMSNCVNFTFLEETYKFKTNYSSVKIYNKDIKERGAIITEKKIHKDFVIIYSDIFSYEECSTSAIFEKWEKWYILETGTFVVRAFNHADQWFSYNTGEFCFELQLKANDDGTLVSKYPEVIIYYKNSRDNLEPKSNTRQILSSYAMVVSSVFMALVLLVYALLPELRNLMGLMLMAYLAITIVFFLLRSIHILANNSGILDVTACSVITLLFYYSLLSSFSWINVMSFDIWWTISRSLPVDIKGRIDRKGRRRVPRKFWWYNLHGWGTPLILTVFVIVVDIIDLRHLPYFVKPNIINGNSCYFKEEEYLRYVSIPILILILTSLVLFVMTVVRIWLVRRDVKTMGTTTNQTGFRTYVTLSLVMGITWVFEVLSNIVSQESAWWYISDVYNIFVGFFLFLAFVCKKKVLLSLCKKFSVNNEFVRKLSEYSNATDHGRSTHSTVSATNSVDVNAHPAGDQELTTQHK